MMGHRVGAHAQLVATPPAGSAPAGPRASPSRRPLRRSSAGTSRRPRLRSGRTGRDCAAPGNGPAARRRVYPARERVSDVTLVPGGTKTLGGPGYDRPWSLRRVSVERGHTTEPCRDHPVCVERPVWLIAWRRRVNLTVAPARRAGRFSDALPPLDTCLSATMRCRRRLHHSPMAIVAAPDRAERAPAAHRWSARYRCSSTCRNW